MTKVYYATPLLVWALGINLTLAGAQTPAPRRLHSPGSWAW